MKRTRILLGDDHPLFLEGGREILEERYEIVGTAVNGQALVESALRLRPDLILLDISMPLLSGIEAARRIRASLPSVKLLFLTMHSERTYLRSAFDAGGTGYVLKSARTEELLFAVQKVLDGYNYVSSELWDYGGRTGVQEQIAGSAALSQREREVLQLIADGWSGKEIAGILSISSRTIAFHRENIKRKLGVTTIAAMVRHALGNAP